MASSNVTNLSPLAGKLSESKLRMVLAVNLEPFWHTDLLLQWFALPKPMLVAQLP